MGVKTDTPTKFRLNRNRTSFDQFSISYCNGVNFTTKIAYILCFILNQKNNTIEAYSAWHYNNTKISLNKKIILVMRDRKILNFNWLACNMKNINIMAAKTMNTVFDSISGACITILFLLIILTCECDTNILYTEHDAIIYYILNYILLHHDREHNTLISPDRCFF